MSEQIEASHQRDGAEEERDTINARFFQLSQDWIAKEMKWAETDRHNSIMREALGKIRFDARVFGDRWCQQVACEALERVG